MDLPTVSPAQIRAGASDEVYARGVNYHRGGAVAALVLRGTRLHAEVMGSEDEPYNVVVVLGNDGVEDAQCDCPYDWGGWCKHIVATLLAYNETRPADLERRPPLAELLAALDREQLLALLLRLADAKPALAELVEGLVPFTSVPLQAPQAAAAPPRGAVAPDPAAVRRQVRGAFRGNGYGVQVLDALGPITQQLAAALADGDVDGVMAALEALTEEYSEQWVEYEDDEGELADFFNLLGALWAEALLDADLAQDERETWSHKLGDWNDEAAEYGVEGLSLAVHALDEGWDAPWLVAALRGEAAPESLMQDWDARALLPIRLRVLERKGLLRDALSLAVATGRASDEARLLTRLGRVDEAVALAETRFQQADEALALATTLQAGTDRARALAVAERGLELAPPRAPLASWLLEQAAAAGNLALALRAGQVALVEAPALALYTRLQGLAGRAWPEVSARLHMALRTTPAGWSNTRGLVEIWLHAGLIDEAIAVAQQPGGASELSRVVDAAATARPEWVVETAIAQAEAIAESGRSHRYDEAIAWLERVRDLQLGSIDPDAWPRYVASFRARFGRKTKLMSLLDQLERRRRR